MGRAQRPTPCGSRQGWTIALTLTVPTTILLVVSKIFLDKQGALPPSFVLTTVVLLVTLSVLACAVLCCGSGCPFSLAPQSPHRTSNMLSVVALVLAVPALVAAGACVLHALISAIGKISSDRQCCTRNDSDWCAQAEPFRRDCYAERQAFNRLFLTGCVLFSVFIGPAIVSCKLLCCRNTCPCSYKSEPNDHVPLV
eukprot:c13918_g1_i1.p1 GENE.c13918_g1_i1~~c13918_g1_i1.p1  ORF type:complete len:197 (-),score=8.93 c13918_g1_i1:320-910(-)